MSASTVLEMLAAQIDQGPLIFPLVRAEEEPALVVSKVYRMWITPAGQPSFCLPVEALSLHEARESATKAAPHLPQVGNRPFTVSGRMA